jgi:hypothetical protein
MISSLNDFYSQSSFSTLPPCPDVLQQRLQDRIYSSSRARSASSSILPTPSTSFPPHTIKNPMSVQPPTKQTRKQSPLSINDFDQSRMTQFNQQIYPNTSTSLQHFDDKFKNYSQNRQTNGVPSNYPYIRQYQQFQINSTPTNLLQHILRQKGEMINQDFYVQHQPSSSLFNESNRYTPSPSFTHSPSK